MVTIKNGVYLIIEHTEAMHVIDVNSGNRLKSSKSPEDNAFDVNLLAAEEIARQLRLRDMGGIITCDFIDMHTPAHKSMLYKKMQEFMANDKAKHTIHRKPLQPSCRNHRQCFRRHLCNPVSHLLLSQRRRHHP